VWLVTGELTASDGSFSSASCTSIGGIVGLGETFWVTRDSDGVSSPRSVLAIETGVSGPVVVDWS
jgi:hypothetical protein